MYLPAKIIYMSNNFENYLNGQYVGAFSEEKPFGPHVRRCVCDRCHAAFLAESKLRNEEYKLKEAALTPEQLEYRNEMVKEILDQLSREPRIEPTPNPAVVKVGDRVRICGNSLNKGRIGTVIEMPGPSTKYGGADAQRIEVLLDATIDDEWDTMWTDNGRYGWLELA